jgi:SAM-dependent methyltransferase
MMQVLRSWWAKVGLEGRLWFSRSGVFDATKLEFPELAEKLESRLPELRPYEGLAELWHSHSLKFTENHSAYLMLIRRKRQAVGSILDLACGTGILTAHLASIFPEVIGLDLSETMLAKAREHCYWKKKVKFFQGDFRDFHLHRQFDIVVCALNSLNYVGNAGDLQAVFKCAAEHLRPDGLFLFDATTSSRMKSLTGLYSHTKTDKGRFVIRWEYDPVHRKQEALVVTSSGIEIHHRIAIDPEDVQEASAGTGLLVERSFGNPLGPTCVFIMRKAPSETRE